MSIENATGATNVGTSIWLAVLAVMASIALTLAGARRGRRGRHLH